MEVPRGGVESISQEDLRRDVHLHVQATEAEPGTGGEPGARVPVSPGSGSGPEPELAAFVRHRFRQMHLLPAFGDDHLRAAGEDAHVCGLREGRGQGAQKGQRSGGQRSGGQRSGGRWVVALDGGTGADRGASPVAVAISLAKGGDVPTPPERTALICRAAPGRVADLLASPPRPWSSVEALLLLGPLGGDTLSVHPVADLPVTAWWATTGEQPDHGTARDGAAAIDYEALQRRTRQLYRWFLEGDLGPPPGGPAGEPVNPAALGSRDP